MFIVVSLLALTLSTVEGAIERSIAELYTARPERAYSIVEAALADPDLNNDERLRLEIQRLSIEQTSRLVGKPMVGEQETVLRVARLARLAGSGDLRGQAQLRLTISAYYDALLSGRAATVMSLVPRFNEAAALISTPCVRAEALFFAGVMPQISGDTAKSRAGLEIADRAAREARCLAVRSFTERHLAVVALDASDMNTASKLAEHSLSLRRRLRMRIYLPFSLLLVSDIRERGDDRASADRYALEAAKRSMKANLPAGLAAACKALAGRAAKPSYC